MPVSGRWSIDFDFYDPERPWSGFSACAGLPAGRAWDLNDVAECISVADRAAELYLQTSADVTFVCVVLIVG